MTYLRSTDNLLALILVLMISLITKPVFGMPSHQMNMVAISASAHHMTLTSEDIASKNCHQPAHLLSEPQSECCSQTDTMSSFCSDCSSAHCQPYSSYLPIGIDAFTDFPRDRLIPLLTSVHPVSRTETLFRPPIL